jgi:hypothetical protein
MRGWERRVRRQLQTLIDRYERCVREFLAWPQCRSFPHSTVQQLSKSLAAFCTQCSDEEGDSDSDAPIFLLAIGWRSGSTLLQRILITEPHLLLWGEPLGEMTVFSRLVEMLIGSISSRNMQLWKDQPDPDSVALSRSWIAVLYPPREALRLGLRSFFDRWLRSPALGCGFVRWGLKEVRFGAMEAVFLRWLYPKAKFIVLSRHPYDCYRSLADAHWDQVYYRYPDFPIDSAASFAKHWNRLAISWSCLPIGFPSVHIRYEDLIGHKVDFRWLESWLGIRVHEEVALSEFVGHTSTRERLTWYERMIIRSEALDGMRTMKYV